LRTDQEFQITTDSHDQYCPALYGNIVVWTDERNGNADIYGFNLLSPVTPVLFDYRMKLILISFFCGILVALPALASVCREAYVKRIASERMGSLNRFHESILLGSSCRRVITLKRLPQRQPTAFILLILILLRFWACSFCANLNQEKRYDSASVGKIERGVSLIFPTKMSS